MRYSNIHGIFSVLATINLAVAVITKYIDIRDALLLMFASMLMFYVIESKEHNELNPKGLNTRGSLNK